mmetsp:Transcript_22953/g.60428  ORF Transcript_22953/g.60428 Transcript_22953/m.60428 type:complete len:218 (-) Transcript_22953:472-1125(-)
MPSRPVGDKFAVRVTTLGDQITSPMLITMSHRHAARTLTSNTMKMGATPITILPKMTHGISRHPRMAHCTTGGSRAHIQKLMLFTEPQGTSWPISRIRYFGIVAFMWCHCDLVKVRLVEMRATRKRLGLLSKDNRSCTNPGLGSSSENSLYGAAWHEGPKDLGRASAQHTLVRRAASERKRQLRVIVSGTPNNCVPAAGLCCLTTSMTRSEMAPARL